MHGIQPGELVLGTDNGSAFTARRFREMLSGQGIRHRRGGFASVHRHDHAVLMVWVTKDVVASLDAIELPAASLQRAHRLARRHGR